VLAELRRSGLPGGPSKSYQLPPTRRNDRPDEAARTASALAVWRETRPANGTIVETYLANRGLALPPPQFLRFHPACPHLSGANLPAMIGLVEHLNHGPTAIHRTFISADGSGKAAVEPEKASLGPVAGGAVRLAQVRAGQWLLVAEGLETTFSVMHACAFPGWAALSAGAATLCKYGRDLRRQRRQRRRPARRKCCCRALSRRGPTRPHRIAPQRLVCLRPRQSRRSALADHGQGCSVLTLIQVWTDQLSTAS
jgi:hypothetical protein